MEYNQQVGGRDRNPTELCSHGSRILPTSAAVHQPSRDPVFARRFLLFNNRSRETMMKKSVFIAAALALAVVGCSDKQAADAKAAADKAATAAKEAGDKAAAAAKDATDAAKSATSDAMKSASDAMKPAPAPAPAPADAAKK